MSQPALLAGLLALAVVIASARLVLRQIGAAAGARSAGWRLAVLLLLQPVCALLLYLTLLPPALFRPTGTLIVATRHAPWLGTGAAGDALVALPEAPALPGAERAPDLATALRRHPEARTLRILGEGLAPRDREAPRGRAVAFTPPAPPRGIAQLALPAPVAPGAAFRFGGRVAGIWGGTAELIDPAGRRVATTPLGVSGDFALGGTARAAGLALFTLRVRDAGHGLIEEAAIPLRTIAAAPPRLLLLAGAPGPELKYLRRWASDAGLTLHTQVSVGGGMALGDTPVPIDAATLRGFDLVVLDDRSWAALGGGARAALIAGVRDGLGLLIRVTGPVPDAVRGQWRALGLGMGGGGATPLTLPAEAPGADATGAPLKLTRYAVPADANAVPLLQDAAGGVIARWRNEGRGRIALWPVADSYGLVLAGHGDLYGALWSQAFATLSRAQPGVPPAIDPLPRAGRRMALCALGDRPEIIAPNGRTTALLPDPASGAAACAAYWPDAPGWHVLRQTADGKAPQLSPFYVFAAEALPGARAGEARDATLALVGGGGAIAGPAARSPVPGTAWPWFLGWLAASAALWWFERSRIGHTTDMPAIQPA